MAKPPTPPTTDLDPKPPRRRAAAPRQAKAMPARAPATKPLATQAKPASAAARRKAPVHTGAAATQPQATAATATAAAKPRGAAAATAEAAPAARARAVATRRRAAPPAGDAEAREAAKASPDAAPAAMTPAAGRTIVRRGAAAGGGGRRGVDDDLVRCAAATGGPPPARDARAATAAGPKRAKPRKPRATARKTPPDRLKLLVTAAVKSLEDDKAENVVVLDVTGRASFTDRMILATGLADRQIQAMAAHLDQAFGEHGLKLRRDSVQASDDWVLIDAGDIVVHLFRAEKREELNLEKMWGPDSPLGEAGPGEKSPI